MRRPDTALLHGPWEDADTPDLAEVALAELQTTYPKWRIWRAMSPTRVPGEWCARRADPTPALRGLSATSAAELRSALEEAER